MSNKNSKLGNKSSELNLSNQDNQRQKTLSERYEIVKIFNNHCKQNSVKDSAIFAGAPLSSIYRWQKEFEMKFQPTNRHLNTGLNINEAIKVLIDNENYPVGRMLEACFKIIVWLRWPTEEAEHQTLICSCMAAYCIARHKPKNLTEIDETYKNVIIQNLSLEFLAKLSSVEGSTTPWFYMERIQDGQYTQSDVLAVIVWYLLSTNEKTSALKKRVLRKDTVITSNLNKPSLSKAYYLFCEKAFKYKFEVSRTTFDKVWKTNAPAAPFLYVQSFVPGVEWSLDPASDTFADEVDHLLADLPSRRLFFARCKWVIEALQFALDPRALREVTFPKFPDELEVEPVTAPPLTILIHTKLKTYKSG